MTGPRPSRRPWTARDVQWLMANYARLGSAECARQLGRGKASVTSKAHHLGLTNQRAVRKYSTTEAIDRRIWETYSHGVRPGDVQALAAAVGRPDWWVKRRARELGAKPMRGGDYSPWTEEETELLYRTIGLSPAQAAAHFRRLGFHRSASSIQRRRWHLRIQPEDGGWYSVAQVAELMGAHDKTVRGWIRRGLLNAQAQGENAATKGAARVYRIRDRDLSAFLANHPTEWDMRKVIDQLWLVDMLTNTQAK